MKLLEIIDKIVECFNCAFEMQQLFNELITPVLTIFAATLSAILLLKKVKETRQLPPGPWGLPVVGYLPFLSKKAHLKITELSKKYGPILSMKLGPVNVVFLNDWESVKDAFSKDEFLGRPEQLRETGFFRAERNVVTESGPFWREQRRFAFRSFRDLGFGKQVMESNIKDEISYFIREIEKKMEKPVNIHQLLTPSVSNNICYLVFGKRFDYDHPKRQYLDLLLADVPRLLNVITLIAIVPLVKHFLPIFGSSEFKRTLKNVQEFENIIDSEVDKHEDNKEAGDAKDYIDGYLEEMKAREDKNDVGSFTRDVINSNARGFFGAGSETVRTTMDWIMKQIAVHQDIQKKVQNEIDSVVGSNRTPSWSDRELMPFTQAVILETQRWASVVPLNIPRRTTADTNVLGHFIPKNTVVIANFWAINRDPKLWKNPEEFNPYRFLTEDGKLKHEEALVPFSVGKRACVGETLAKFELFLYFTTIMQKFTIEEPSGVKTSFESKLGVTLQPTQVPILNFKKR